jgi:hypothetical protein
MSGCDRDLDVCVADLAELQTHDGVGPATASECTYQKNAAVFSFYDVMHDAYRVSTYGSMRDCQSGRVFRAKTFPNDYTNLSSCDVVGATGTPMNRKLVPSGQGWYCVRFQHDDREIVAACFRDEDACDRQAGDGMTCVSRKRAWAVTKGERVRVLGAFAICNTSRLSGESRCEEVD